MSKWRRWRALGANDRRETLRAAALVPLCEISLRVLGLARTRKRFARVASRRSLDTGAIERAARAVERVRCYSPLNGTCLSRSLVLERLLRKHGIACDLRFGAQQIGNSIAGHAWIEVDGRPLNDTPDVHRTFPPLDRRRSGGQEN